MIEDIKDKGLRLEDHPLLREYTNIFSKEVPVLPPRREINFSIHLVPGATLISKEPYIMSSPNLLGLKLQLQELMDKNYIRPNVSPWGVSILFVKKKDGTL